MKCNKLMSCGRRSFVRNTLALMVVGVPVLWSCSRDENASEDAADATDGGSRAGAQSPDTRAAQQDMSEEMTGGNETKAAKTDVNYQDSPAEGRRCSDCRNFVDEETPGEGARCHVVEGVISPSGYCDLFSPRT